MRLVKEIKKSYLLLPNPGRELKGNYEPTMLFVFIMWMSKNLHEQAIKIWPFIGVRKIKNFLCGRKFCFVSLLSIYFCRIKTDSWMTLVWHVGFFIGFPQPRSNFNNVILYSLLFYTGKKEFGWQKILTS